MPKLLGTIIRNLFSKPATVNYPFEASPLVEGTRGSISFNMDRCDQCQDCERVCPSAAIKVYPDDKKIEWDQFKCIYCHLCVETCMHKAITALDHVQSPDYKKSVTVFES
ncbi:MAG: 4Fe-4S binding protein [Candidatus Bathyarchaeota archaeon]|nr:4Fe-4S binding protein [Candidatus Bathyarchaeota archaeon]